MKFQEYLHRLMKRIGDFFFVRRADEKLDETLALDINEVKKELQKHGIA